MFSASNLLYFKTFFSGDVKYPQRKIGNFFLFLFTIHSFFFFMNCAKFCRQFKTVQESFKGKTGKFVKQKKKKNRDIYPTPPILLTGQKLYFYGFLRM